MDSWIKENVDLTVLAIVTLLVAIGIASIYSATVDSQSVAFFYRPIVFAGIGFLVMMFIALLPFRTLQLLSYPLYGVSMIMLTMILVMGKVVAGSKSWFGVGGFGLQPSEFVKVT